MQRPLFFLPTLFFLPLLLALAGCATPPPPAPPVGLFNDAAFERPAVPVNPADAFALSEPMRRYLNAEVRPMLRRRGSPEGLIDALYSHHELALTYDGTRTRTAAEAFDARSGNCLSLVLMTAAFAKELGMAVTYNTADREEIWGRTGDLLVRSGHVNITVGVTLDDYKKQPVNTEFTVDFLPASQLTGLTTREVREGTVLAMYMNNRAVEAMLRGDLDQAYALARAAVVQDPTFSSAMNTLGVVYLRHGDLDHAQFAFERVLDRAPRNTRAMSNLAEALDRQGRTSQAGELRRKLAALEPYPPFYYFQRGLAAMDRGDYRAARDLFEREVARADYEHEFHYWLALAEYRLGDFRVARRELEQAEHDSTSDSDRSLYASKLAWLQSQAQTGGPH